MRIDLQKLKERKLRGVETTGTIQSLGAPHILRVGRHSWKSRPEVIIYLFANDPFFKREEKNLDTITNLEINGWYFSSFKSPLVLRKVFFYSRVHL